MNNKSLPPAVFLMGPTASGKTGAVVELIQHLPIELISVDSALVYQDMDIGTAKPDPATLITAPHHLIDIIPPTAAYSAASFRSDALQLMAEITARGKTPVLVGGTMLYFKALESGLSGLPEASQMVRSQLDLEAEAIGWPEMHKKLAAIDPKTAARLMPNDRQRIQRALEVYEITGETMTDLFSKQISDTLPYSLLKVCLIPGDRKVLHTRIELRFKQMLKQGFLDEVENLLIKYPSLTAESTAMRCVGYRQALACLSGQYSATELQDRGIFATRQLAKRQLTWLRGVDNKVEVDCLAPNMYETVLELINQLLQRAHR